MATVKFLIARRSAGSASLRPILAASAHAQPALYDATADRSRAATRSNALAASTRWPASNSRRHSPKLGCDRSLPLSKTQPARTNAVDPLLAKPSSALDHAWPNSRTTSATAAIGRASGRDRDAACMRSSRGMMSRTNCSTAGFAASTDSTSSTDMMPDRSNASVDAVVSTMAPSHRNGPFGVGIVCGTPGFPATNATIVRPFSLSVRTASLRRSSWFSPSETRTTISTVPSKVVSSRNAVSASNSPSERCDPSPMRSTDAADSRANGRPSVIASRRAVSGANRANVVATSVRPTRPGSVAASSSTSAAATCGRSPAVIDRDRSRTIIVLTRSGAVSASLGSRGSHAATIRSVHPPKLTHGRTSSAGRADAANDAAARRRRQTAIPAAKKATAAGTNHQTPPGRSIVSRTGQSFTAASSPR